MTPQIAGKKDREPHNACPVAGAGNGDDLRDRLSGLRRLLIHWPISAAALIGLALGLFGGITFSSIPLAPTAPPPSMTACTADTIAAMRQGDVVTASLLQQAREHCYSVIHSQGLLRDFSLREMNYLQQYRANGILMWMVVVVTLSGVTLAGVQLFASYELARRNKSEANAESKIEVARNRIVLKSSITGLFILVVSFAFFLVFVFYVYRFEPPSDHDNQPSSPAAQIPLGGLGPPAATAPPPSQGR